MQLIGQDRTVFAQLDAMNRLWSFALRAGWATHQRVCRLGAPAHEVAGVCSAHTPSEIPPVSCWLPGPGPVCLRAAEPAHPLGVCPPACGLDLPDQGHPRTAAFILQP